MNDPESHNFALQSLSMTKIALLWETLLWWLKKWLFQDRIFDHKNTQMYGGWTESVLPTEV
jgi:hypothetical protein